jgi:hypothetical protein
MRIPAVLSTVHVTIDADGHLAIDVDGDPHPTARGRARGDLRSILDEITTGLGTAVRVDVREHDGSTYADIATPPTPTPTPPADTTPGPDPPPAEAANARSAPSAGLGGTGFLPGEEVAVTYVVCTQTAGADGRTAVQLPPALLVRPGLKMLLVGMTSAAIAEVEPT